MTRREDNPNDEATPARVNPGYAALQIARALTTSEEHDDPGTRQRARQKISKWETVLQNILNGSVEYGSRTPVEAVPAWATLEVVTGGFATGELLAGGPLQQHEKSLMQNLQGVREGDERRALNAYFLTDAGLDELQEKLQTGSYDIGVPEEGALMVLAWLVKDGCVEEARELLSKLSPYFASLRFYPIPLDHARRFGSRVHLQDVGSTINDLKKIGPNNRILAQKEAVEVWAPWYDRMVALFLETVADGWPCRQYPEGWSDRALALLGEYALLRSKHKICGKPERARGHFAQLREFLGRCATKPESLTGREVGRIRLILNRYQEKRGAPNSPTCSDERHRQQTYVSGPTFHEIAGLVVPRLAKHSSAEGLDDVSHLKVAVSEEEAASFGVPVSTEIPVSIQRKVERCLNETVEVLIERGLITSGEALARVLPQMISGLRAAGISDAELRTLYASIYRAFRRRRSLLLLNLESQIQIEELPWIQVVERFRTAGLSSRELSRQALEELTLLTVTSFPHAILPNKLLQELRALAKGAELDIPLVDEVAADIFMGQFSGKFIESAKRAADLLDGTLYATYYGIDYQEIRKMPTPQKPARARWFWSRTAPSPDPFVQLCASRAGVALGSWDPATNGMIIEQQQILTTQNLAALFSGLALTDALRDQLEGMAKECFTWICNRQKMKIDRWHARLIMLKNTAYAWRQMVFFLSLLPREMVAEFLGWAEGYLEDQREEFRNRFRPALKGLALAAEGRSLEAESDENRDVRRFLGWSKARHWLLPESDDVNELRSQI
jgi:hypothetical protein